VKTILITGGAGFFGDILKRSVLSAGHSCVSIDLEHDDFTHPRFTAYQGDIRDTGFVNEVCSHHRFDAVFHCAAILAHAGKTKEFLWTSNVDGTRNIRDAAIAHAVPKIIFTSSNCLWGKDMQRPVREDDEPSPVELYGQSKWEGEKILLERRDQIDTVIFRCPTIIDEGRLGLLAILFAFIDEGRRVWMVGGGRNRYQFIYGQDLASACMKTLDRDIAGVFNIGSDDVPTIRETYASMIARAGTGARVASLPCWVAIPLMKLAYMLGLSPLGPYHYKMIAENFLFDTTKIKSSLDWKPTATNKDMLWKAYEYYHAHRDMLEKRTHVSAHKQPAKMGIIRLLKWLS
jgi:nucleoside-diphosphate-sugar epimerase